MTLKSDSKFEEKLTCGFKYDVRNFVNPDLVLLKIALEIG